MFGINTLKKFNSELLATNSQLINSVKALQTFNTASAISQIRTMIFPNWAAIREIDAYIIFDDVYTVVSRLATLCAQIPLVGYDDNTNQDLQPNDNLNLYLKTLTFEEKEILYTWVFLCGELFIYKDTLKLGPNKGKLKTKTLHPAFMTVIQDVNFPYTILGYKYQDTMTTFTLLPEEVIYIKYFNPTTNYNERHRGMSPIKALAQRLTRLQANMSASVSQMQNGGVPSIVYDKTPGIDQHMGSGGAAAVNEVSVMGQHKDNFSRFLRNSDNKGAPYFAAGEMGVLPLGLSLVEMDALIMGDVDFDKICNAYSVSSTEFNNKKASTESNVSQMGKATYTNAVIPNVTRICNGLSMGTHDVFGDNKCVKANYSGVEVLQENKKDKATMWATMPAIVINEMRLDFGQDESADEMADKLLIKSGYQLADDLSIDVPPIDNTANDYVAPAK